MLERKMDNIQGHFLFIGYIKDPKDKYKLIIDEEPAEVVRLIYKLFLEGKGRATITKILNDEEYKKELDKKLQEEVKEYLEDDNIEELADIVEVIYGILASKDVSLEDLKKNADEALEYFFNK